MCIEVLFASIDCEYCNEKYKKKKNSATCYNSVMQLSCSRNKNMETLLSLWFTLAPWSRVILEKLTDSQLVKKFPAFYGT
jgi:hypothetical protein